MSTLWKNRRIVTWDKFRDKIKNNILKKFRHVEDVPFIATDLEDPAKAFESIYMHKYLTGYEEMRPSKQKMWEIKLKKYLDREDIMQENKKICMR